MFLLQGQWNNNTFNGQGTMVHCSGMSFEGLWINGQPSLLASKLVVSNVDGCLEVVQGVPFNLEIECQNEDGETVEGRWR